MSRSARGAPSRRALLLGTLAVLVLLVLAWAVLTRRGGGGTSGGMHPVGDLRVAVEVRPPAPKVGENTLRVVVRDAAGRPVPGLTAAAVVSMPQMGAMPAMESRPELRATGPGTFEGTFGLAMGGSWDVDLALMRPGGEVQHVPLRLTVGMPGATWLGEEEAMAERAGAGAAPGAITIPAARRQEIGITVDTVRVRDLDHDRRTTGTVAYDETRLAAVTLKFQAWIQTLRADFTGQPVRQGEVLFTVYSPDLYAAEREYIEALTTADSLPAGPPRERARELADAARRRLTLWDLTPAQVAHLARTRRPQRDIPIVSPVSGVITDKMIVQGSSVMPGMVLYRIAPLDPIWVLADVFQYELPVLRPGDPVTVRLPAAPEPGIAGRISFIAPALAESTRTGQARVAVRNPRGVLRPGMFVDVTLHVPLGRRLAVPAAAVLYEGDRRQVFVDRGHGLLEPRDVVLGPRAGDWFAVESGLAAGDVVVTSGNFLVSSESRLRSPAGR